MEFNDFIDKYKPGDKISYWMYRWIFDKPENIINPIYIEGIVHDSKIVRRSKIAVANILTNNDDRYTIVLNNLDPIDIFPEFRIDTILLTERNDIRIFNYVKEYYIVNKHMCQLDIVKYETKLHKLNQFEEFKLISEEVDHDS